MGEYARIAELDRVDALKLFEYEMYRLCVISAQQSAEKYCKDILEYLDADSKHLKTHNIAIIISAVSVLMDKDLSHLRQPAIYLSSFYFSTRYPGDFLEPTESDAQTSLDALDLIYKWWQEVNK